jgi:transposase
VLAELARLRAENAELRGRLDAALKHRFGRRSERQPRRRPTDDKPPPRRDEHGRAPLPERLERREAVCDLTEAERLCPCCGQARVCIGEQATEQLDLGPARFFVLRTVRKSYACRRCDPAAVPAEQRLRTAGPAQVGPLAKGLCGPGLLAQVITAKFADHTPLHRLAGQLARSGVAVARATLGGWLAGAADLLGPLCGLMHRRLLLSRVVHGVSASRPPPCSAGWPPTAGTATAAWPPGPTPDAPPSCPPSRSRPCWAGWPKTRPSTASRPPCGPAGASPS